MVFKNFSFKNILTNKHLSSHPENIQLPGEEVFGSLEINFSGDVSEGFRHTSC